MPDSIGRRHRSVSEAVHAVRPLQYRQAVLDAEIDRARSDIEAGADQLDQGLIVDAGTFFAEWDTELERAHRAPATSSALTPPRP